MTANDQSPAGDTKPADQNSPRSMSPPAKRALQEAEARRRAETTVDQNTPEVGGRDGPDPVRYGDWEKNGIASDF